MKLSKTLFLLLFFIVLQSCSDDFENNHSEDLSLQIEKRQLFIDNWIPPTSCQAEQLTISFSPCFGSSSPWESALDDAIEAYNNAGTSIHFTKVDLNADIKFECSLLSGPCEIGLGEWPTVDFTVGQTVYLNTQINDCIGLCDNIPPCFYQGVIMHEIGHNLGFGHNTSNSFTPWLVGPYVENDNGDLVPNGAQSTGSHIPGTAPVATYDPGSIMNPSGDCTITPCEFNENDLLALRTHYPILFDGPDAICLEVSGLFCISEFIEDAEDIIWDISPNKKGVLVQSVGDNCMSISISNNNVPNHTITITVTDGACTKTKEVEIVTESVACPPPTSAPLIFQDICIGEAVCYDFENFGCIKDIEITSSSSKILVETNGTEVCLTTITSDQEDVTLTVEIEDYCGGGGVTQWTISINDEDECGFGFTNGKNK